jgi:hypothetical protein
VNQGRATRDSKIATVIFNLFPFSNGSGRDALHNLWLMRRQNTIGAVAQAGALMGESELDQQFRALTAIFLLGPSYTQDGGR